MTTYFDLEVDRASESWRRIRSMRATPSAALKKMLSADRAKVFHMALEQSQQLFDAAGKIDYESRALNLFYGVSQAGRSIAAASELLGSSRGDANQRTWSPASHGLNLASANRSAPLQTEVSVLPSTKDSFSRLSIAIGSPTNTGAVALGAVLAQLYEVQVNYQSLLPWIGPLFAVGVYGGSLDPAAEHSYEIKLAGFDFHQGTSLAEVRAHLDSYPSLRGLPVRVDENGLPIHTHNPGHVVLGVRVSDLENGSAGMLQLRASQMYRAHRVNLPVVGRASEVLKPLASWWLVLYALSMLSRYFPAEWGDALNIQTSPVASMIEHTLDVALDAVPNLIAETLTTLNS